MIEPLVLPTTRRISGGWCVVMLCLFLLLSGCTATSSHKMDKFSTEERWQHHQTALKNLNAYQVSGSFAYISGAKKSYAKFSWQQSSPDNVTLQLTTPFGNRLATLTRNGSGALFEDNQGNTYHDEKMEALLFRLTGLDLPVSQLSTLLIGWIDDETPHELTSRGQLKSTKIQQDDKIWTIEFDDYKKEKKIMLPRRIEFKHDDITLTLNLSRWSLP